MDQYPIHSHLLPALHHQAFILPLASKVHTFPLSPRLAPSYPAVGPPPFPFFVHSKSYSPLALTSTGCCWWSWWWVCRCKNPSRNGLGNQRSLATRYGLSSLFSKSWHDNDQPEADLGSDSDSDSASASPSDSVSSSGSGSALTQESITGKTEIRQENSMGVGDHVVEDSIDQTKNNQDSVTDDADHVKDLSSSDCDTTTKSTMSSPDSKQPIYTLEKQVVEPQSFVGKRALGIDYGSRVVGLCVSVGFSPTPIAPVLHHRKPALAASKVAQVVEKEMITTVVIGLPLNSRGEEGEMVQQVRVFAKALAWRIPWTVIYLWDERFSTYTAKCSLELSGVRKDRIALLIDSASAVSILEDFYDHQGVGAWIFRRMRQRVEFESVKPTDDKDRITVSYAQHKIELLRQAEELAANNSFLRNKISTKKTKKKKKKT